ncbi:catalase [Pedobacter frigiditerrae]|uniref:catalase n=2 Tax=Pedobacter frigiditerrae TaxID=2530452 RepID=A0A4R0MNX7_9SPHI|nr:catalase [Pedobacter frigiditerrae]
MEKLTTASGIPYFNHEDTLSVGARGPLLLEDFILHEKLAHFNRERIPERVVHAKGSGAFGTFTVTQNITQFTKAKLFNEVEKKTNLFLRFSTVGGEKGSADTERDPRGFAVKFYTEDGNWDLVGNNTPIFFLKDPKKFPDFIHTQKRDPYTNCKNPTMVWDFFSLNPETLHQVMFLMSDRGTPYGYRYMHGFASHTYTLLNDKNEVTYVKFHFKSQQGIKNLTANEANKMKAEDPDFGQRDLVNAIDSGDFPKWTLKMQLMGKDQARNHHFNPFDLTKTWSQKEFPLMEIGVLELNENPTNYFATVEQAAFSPSRIVDGIGFSPDKMLQGRILSYPDAQRYRLGTNYEQIPINTCPFMSHNYQRDGQMTVNANGGKAVNYYPNSFQQIEPDPSYMRPATALDSNIADWYNRNAPGEDDHFTQPGLFFRDVLTDIEKLSLIGNIVDSMKGIAGDLKETIINRQLCHFFRADLNLGIAIANGLDIEVGDKIKH